MMISFDPGSISGAYAVLDSAGKFVTCGDIPVSPLGGAGKGQINPALLAALLREIKPDLAVIERVNAFPGQGVSSGFRFGCAFVIILGVVAALKIPFLLVSPGPWKKAMGCAAHKDASRTIALQHFPEAAPHLKLKKHHGRGDALLLALYQYQRAQPAS
jgi:crossover junction endodeoxyribonuclease RuvC